MPYIRIDRHQNAESLPMAALKGKSEIDSAIAQKGFYAGIVNGRKCIIIPASAWEAWAESGAPDDAIQYMDWR